MSRAPNGLLSMHQPTMHREHVRILPVNHPPEAKRKELAGPGGIGVFAGLRGHVHTMWGPAEADPAAHSRPNNHGSMEPATNQPTGAAPKRSAHGRGASRSWPPQTRALKQFPTKPPRRGRHHHPQKLPKNQTTGEVSHAGKSILGPQPSPIDVELLSASLWPLSSQSSRRI